MATATAPKVRLVRCPKCLLVLPEVADFPVYKCGGCDTILVAKNKKAIAKTTSVLQETEAASAKRSIRVSEHGESSSSALQEVVPSPSSQESGGNQDISTGSRGEGLGEDLSVEGEHNWQYEKDRNTSRFGNGYGGRDRDMLDDSRLNEGKHNGTGLLQTDYEKNTPGEIDGESGRGMLDESRSKEGQRNGAGLLRMKSLDRYEKDRNTSRYSDGDDESDSDMLDGSRSYKGKLNGTGLLQKEPFDRYEKDRNTSRYSDGDDESDSDMLDGSRSYKGKLNGTGLLQTEPFDRYAKDQNTSRYSDGDDESDSDMLDGSRSYKGKLNGTGLLQTEPFDRYEKDRNTSRYSDGDDESVSDMLDGSRSYKGKLNGTGLLQKEPFDRYEKDRNTSRYSDGDDESDSDMLDGSRSYKEKLYGTGLLQMEPFDRYEKDRNTSRDSDVDGESDRVILDETRPNEGQQNGTGLLQTESFKHCDVQQPGDSTEGSLSTELRHGNEELVLEKSTDPHSEEHDEKLSVQGQHNGRYKKDQNSSRDGDGDAESDCDVLDENRSNEESMLAAGTTIEAEANDMTSRLEGVKSELETSNKIDSNAGGSWIGEHCGVNGSRSTDTFQTVDFVSLCSEFSGPPECLSKSTTIRSSHAYDGSISSYDGIDDHFSDQQLHSFENSYKPAKKKPYETDKYGKWHRDEPLEPVMHHRPPRSWPRPERDQYPSQVPLSQRTPLRGYESAGPSRDPRDEFPFDSAFRPLEKAEYGEEENVKLLRMVYELQDQISRTCNLNGKTNVSASTDVTWKNNHYNNHLRPPEDEIFYPAYYGEHGLNQRSRFSRVPFSGGAINTRHGIDNTCSYCHPQAWKHSEQLPPQFRHNREFCRGGTGHSCYDSYSSLPCSPQRYMESDFSNRVHEIQSDDQRYGDRELKRYLREKHHSVRRHIRPTAGGAPFVTCYHCISPLQLPADFLLFKRRFHQLKCGACSKVLKFSLRKGTNIVPYEPVAAEPPPSEVEDRDDVINARIPGTASSSHCRMQADPLSYSDDYGHSFDISCSTDGNPDSHAKFHHLQGSNADVQNMSSSSSKPMETFDSVVHSRSKKVSSETEGSPPRTGGSTLHRLMGYSSLSQVLRGRRPSISSTSSSHFSKNKSRLE
ncbi:uncharacterized protein LOC120213112 [Hibiscus syriacus]|uniref:uncharacterized protein LOC120213112 n=1 Tax=Hibiscus syriacus TaxID=106335 RepID=UPI00192382C6|nr:uncharacterized protein LOC120213112 [Hibiscus syriacus]